MENEIAAGEFIPAGEAVFTDSELLRYEGYEFPTSQDPTCVLATMRDGTSVWVAYRDIYPGEAYTIEMGQHTKTIDPKMPSRWRDLMAEGQRQGQGESTHAWT